MPLCWVPSKSPGPRSFRSAAQLQVGLGNTETVVRLAHDVDAFAGVFRQFVVSDEDAIALVGAASHSASELMQLGESEALGFEDNHHGGIRYVVTHFYDGGGNEYLCVAIDEFLHLCLLVGGLHLAVHFREAEFREHLPQHLIAVFQVLEVYLLALLYQGEDDIYLSALMNLPADAVVERRQRAVKDVLCHHGLSAGWQFVDDADVQIAV